MSGGGWRRFAINGIVGVLAAVVVSSTAGGGTFTAWGFRDRVNVVGYDKSGTLTDFPLLVVLGTDRISGFSYGQFASPDDGADLRFAASNETDELSYEIERWDTNGDSYVWVQVPLIAGTGDYIYAYWGRASAEAPAYTTNGSVWGGTHLGAWHLDGDEIDSSSRTNHGANSGATAVDGIAAGGRGFGGAAYIDFPANLRNLGATNALAITFWFRSASASSALQCLMEDGTAHNVDSVYLFANAGVNQLATHLRNDAGTGVQLDTVSVPSISTNWHAIGHVYDGASVRTYYDGKQVWTASITGDLNSGNTHLQIGRRPAGSYYLSGAMDEVRVENVSRGSNWVWACWASQTTGSTFVGYGEVETQGLPEIANLPATNVQSTSAWLNGYLSSTGKSEATVSVYWGDEDGGDPSSGLWKATNSWAAGAWTNGTYPTYKATGLTPGTMVYYRYYATNAFGAMAPESSERLLAGEVWVTTTTPSASESGPVDGVFTIYRAESATNGALTVNIEIGGSAENVDDYAITATTTVLMAPGVSNATVTLTPVQDPFDESSETVTLTILPGLYAVGAASNGTVTIADAALARATNETVQAGEWTDPNTWMLARIPIAGDDVIVRHSVLLTNATPWLRSCMVSNVTLTFTNWDSRLWVGEGVVVTGAGANLTCRGNFLYTDPWSRVYVDCGSFTLAAGAKVDVATNGFIGGSATGSGPGRGYGASHGESRPGYSFGASYGSLSAPLDPGSGGLDPYGALGGNGGGAVRIAATGVVSIAGTIDASGQNGWLRGQIHASAGSGGSIYISCRQFAGSPSGLLRVNGGGSGWAGSAGSGGRIAVVYDVGAQAGVNPGVKFAASAGAASSYTPWQSSNVQGTAYFSDASFLSNDMGNAQFSYVTFFADGFTNWAPASLTVSNGTAIDFGYDGFRLDVAGDLTLGDYGTLGFRSNANVTVGGDLSLGFRSKLFIRAGATNALHPDCGALVDIAGDLVVGKECLVVPISHPENGGSVLLRMRDLLIDKDGAIDGSGWGYLWGKGPSPGRDFAAGGGHGGRGSTLSANSGQPCGIANAPSEPGSGGGSSMLNGEGGGLARIEASRNVVLDGRIRMDGNRGAQYQRGGGAGGAIFIQCAELSGATNGQFLASGGSTVLGYNPYGSAGGGGRVAVWTGKPVPPSIRAKIVANESAAYLSYTNLAACSNFLGKAVVDPGVDTDSNIRAGTGSVVVVVYDPPQMAPIISNAVPTGIAAGSAWLNGFLASTGLHDTAVSVYWGDTDGGAPSSGLWKNTNSWALGYWTEGSSPTYQATGLAANTPYYYRYYATNEAGESWATQSEAFVIAEVRVESSDSAASEVGPDPGSFELVRDSAATGVTLTVYYTIGGNAALGSDFALAPPGTSIDIPAGTDRVSIAVTPFWDGNPEGDESVVLTLASGGYLIGTPAFQMITIADALLPAGTNETTSAGLWTNGAIWTLGRLPVVGDDVIVKHAVELDEDSYALRSCTVTNGGTLTLRNWDTAVYADDVLVSSGGKVALPGAFTDLQPSNRICIVCTNLTVGAGGLIDADQGGYARENGPGVGAGASHGGRGGTLSYGPVYGVTNAPTAPGSGGIGAGGGNGGGAIRIDASGVVRVDGTVRASGGGRADGTYGPGGSGGSIYVTCRQFTGSGTGLIQAAGEFPTYGAGGGGGRIAVVYDLAAQGGVNPDVRFDARGGFYYNAFYSRRTAGHGGTIYFPDQTMLSSSLDNSLFIGGQLFIEGWTNWALPSLSVANAAIVLGPTNMVVRVTNDVVIGSGGLLGLQGNSRLECGGALSLTNGGILYAWSGPTNDEGNAHGLLVDVGGAMRIGPGSWVYPRGDNGNGGSALFRCGNLSVATNAGFDADYFGFPQWQGPGRGVAAGPYGSGAGYGGEGTDSSGGDQGGGTYGSSNYPVDLGSGGGNYEGGEGGGAIRVVVGGHAAVDGTMSANGRQAPGVHHGGGSGGTIYISCERFSGGTSAVLRANAGGNSWGGGGGGGGRIAVWSMYRQYEGTASVAGGVWAYGGVTGEVGTVVWGQLPLPGSLFYVR